MPPYGRLLQGYPSSKISFLNWATHFQSTVFILICKVSLPPSMNRKAFISSVLQSGCSGLSAEGLHRFQNVALKLIEHADGEASAPPPP